MSVSWGLGQRLQQESKEVCTDLHCLPVLYFTKNWQKQKAKWVTTCPACQLQKSTLITMLNRKDFIMNIIEELYYGNINPNEKEFDTHSRYATFMEIVSSNESKLVKYLELQPDAKEMQHLFSQMINAQSELLRFSERDRFLEGFNLGARITLDTFVIPQNSVIRDIT